MTNAVIGTWKLMSWIEEETATKIQHKLFGDNPLGYITYTAEGRMSVMFADPRRRAAGSLPGTTDMEAAHLYRTMIAYAGTYTIDGDQVLHIIDMHTNQIWNGTTQKRFFHVAGNQLSIFTVPFVSHVGKEIVATLVWNRM